MTNAKLAEDIALRVFLRSLYEPITVGLVRDSALAVLTESESGEPIEHQVIANRGETK